MSSVVDVFNRALGFAHARSRVAAETENSREAEICRDWYSLVRDTVQEAAFWDSCRRVARLALLSERDQSQNWAIGDPDPQYKYAYALPEDYLRAWYLEDYSEFTIRYDASRERRIISSNTKNAVMFYAGRNDLPSTWSQGQFMATAAGLASYITGPLTGRNELIQFNLQRANEILIEAQADNLNSSSFMVDSIPPWISARGYAESSPTTRFFYPHGNIFAAAGANVNG